MCSRTLYFLVLVHAWLCNYVTMYEIIGSYLQNVRLCKLKYCNLISGSHSQ